MRLVAGFLTALLLTLTVLAGQSYGLAASQVQTLATAVAAEAAAHPKLCHVFADVEPAAGASEARDTQLKVGDSAEELATGAVAVSLMARSQARAAMPARDAPSPWLGGLLRPPRALNG